MRRLALEIASQAVPFATTILDRVLFTAIALRAWGLDGFEYWSLILSVAALLAMFDAGCLQNFANRITAAWARGDRETAIAVYRQSNFVFLVIGLVAAAVAVALALSPALQSLLGADHPQFRSQALLVMLGLGGATALKLVAMNFMATYRSHLSYGRGTIVFAVTDIVRLLVLSAMLLLGASLAAAAIAHLVLTVAGLAWIAHFDIGRRFPHFRYRIAMPHGDALKGSLSMSLAFGLPLLPVMAMQQVPVLLLGGAAAAGTGLVASFVLLRTLGNIARTIVYKAVNILAMELARHSFAGAEQRAERLKHPVNMIVAFLFGAISGALLSYGSLILGFWAGRPSLFDPLVLAAMLLPMVLTPSLMLAQTVLQYRNTPKAWSIGAFTHAAVAAILYLVLPIDDLVLRVAVAAYGGEVLGLGLPVLWASAGFSWKAMLRHEAVPTAVSLGTAGAVIATSSLLARQVAPTTAEGLAVHALVLGALFAAVLFPLLRHNLAVARSVIAETPVQKSSNEPDELPVEVA